MLPRQRRVSRVLFDTVLKQSRLTSSDFFTLRLHSSLEKFPARIGVSVSKKVSPLAVKRNLIKRRVNSIVQKKENELRDSIIVVLFPKKSILDLSFSDLEKEVVFILRKSGALRDM
ncbi:MAG: ribonuclease P protein component [Candidatus Taylorbacteria bacterium]